MNYPYVTKRIREVIYSCETQNQLNRANVYCRLLIKRWAKLNYYSGDISNSMRIIKTTKQLRAWLSRIDMEHSIKTIPNMQKDKK